MWWWFWLWVAAVIILLALPTGYGWRYRRWGPPYPSSYRRYYERRRGLPPPPGGAPVRGDVAVEREPGWGWAADILWLICIGLLIWVIVAIWA